MRHVVLLLRESFCTSTSIFWGDKKNNPKSPELHQAGSKSQKYLHTKRFWGGPVLQQSSTSLGNVWYHISPTQNHADSVRSTSRETPSLVGEARRCVRNSWPKQTPNVASPKVATEFERWRQVKFGNVDSQFEVINTIRNVMVLALVIVLKPFKWGQVLGFSFSRA